MYFIHVFTSVICTLRHTNFLFIFSLLSLYCFGCICHAVRGCASPEVIVIMIQEVADKPVKGGSKPPQGGFDEIRAELPKCSASTFSSVLLQVNIPLCRLEKVQT